MTNLRFIRTWIVILIPALFLIGCGSSTGPAPVVVAPPTNVQLSLDAIQQGGISTATVTWTASTSENDANFSGYGVTTYQVDANNKIVSLFADQLVPKSTHAWIVNDIQRGVKYMTYVRSVLTDGTLSDSVATKVYGGVYFNNDGQIGDQDSQDGSILSAYGWNVNSGNGTAYALSESNAPSIDLYCRYKSGLYFYSPDQYLADGKATLFGLVGTGSDAFYQTNLSEPQYSSIEVSLDNVYLIKTKQGNYIKVWVTNIQTITNANISIEVVSFEYKVQPIANLIMVKK